MPMIISAVFFALVSLYLLLELSNANAKNRDAEKKLSEIRLRESQKGAKSSESGSKKSGEIKKLRKELEYWKKKAEDSEFKKILPAPAPVVDSHLSKFLSNRSNFFNFLYESDPASRAETLKQLGLIPSNDEFFLIFNRLSSGPSPSFLLISKLFGDWINSDRNDFCNFALAMENEKLFQMAAQLIVRTWPPENLSGLGDLLAKAAQNPKLIHLLGPAIMMHSMANPHYAKEWFEMIPEDSALRNSHIRYVAMALVKEKNQESAATWLAGVRPDSVKDAGIFVFVTETAKSDSQIALAFLDRISSDKLRSIAFAGIVGEIAKNDIDEAAAMAYGMSEGDEKDRTYAIIAGNIAASSPETAMDWASAISNEEISRGSILRVADIWMRGENSESFSDWLESAQISDDLRDEINRIVQGIQAESPR